MDNFPNPNGTVALITDFGYKDHFVGAMKGVIISAFPDATVIDISHGISPQDVMSAGFCISACYREFPEGTVFVIVVDPGVGSSRRPSVAVSDRYFFVAPDNGVLSFVAGSDEKIRWFELTERKFFREPVSSTFHGRDIFAPVAAHIASGVSPGRLGSEIFDPVIFTRSEPAPHPDGLAGTVLSVDTFGNLITNLREPHLPAGSVVRAGDLEIGEREGFFAAGAADTPFLILGSAGFFEIAVNGASAAEVLGLEAGDEVVAVHP